jgi:hypothetical protein
MKMLWSERPMLFRVSDGHTNLNSRVLLPKWHHHVYSYPLNSSSRAGPAWHPLSSPFPSIFQSTNARASFLRRLPEKEHKLWAAAHGRRHCMASPPPKKQRHSPSPSQGRPLTRWHRTRTAPCTRATPPSTSPVTEGDAMEACICAWSGRLALTPPSTSRRRQEGEGCATVLPHIGRQWPPPPLCFKCFRRFQTCCRPIFQVFQLFQMYVSSVLYGYYNGCTRMLQASVSNISSIFQTFVASVFIWTLHMFYTYVASVLSRWCMCLQ